jgi:pimeloyl-ACP methyl ester carboxylesterase
LASRTATLAVFALGGLLVASALAYSRIYAPNPHCGDDRPFLPERGRVVRGAAHSYPPATPPPCARNRHGEEEAVGSIEVAHWFVEAAGITWHFVTAGEPPAPDTGAPPVVLLHGFPESWWAFHHQIEALAAAGYHTIAIDVIPYGQSDKRLDLDYRYPAIAAGLLELLDRLRVERFQLVTHDRGTVIGDHLAALPDAEGRVVRYVRMQQSASRPRGESPPHQLMGSPMGTLLYRSRRFPALVYRGRLVALPIAGDVVRRLDYEFKYRGIAEAAPLSFATTSFDQELVDRRERLFARLTMPVLFLQGRLDPGQHPEEYFRVADTVADGELRFVEAGHFLHLEAPAAVNEAILDFLGTADVTTRPPASRRHAPAGGALPPPPVPLAPPSVPSPAGPPPTE